MISLIINSNHFYSKLFSKFKYGIAYVNCIHLRSILGKDIQYEFWFVSIIYMQLNFL